MCGKKEFTHSLTNWTPTLRHGDGQFCISSAVGTKNFVVAKVIYETVSREKTRQGNSNILKYLFQVVLS